MLQSVLTLVPASGRFDDLVAEYRARGIIEAALPFGIFRGEALRLTSDPEKLIISSLWPSGDHYEAWLASKERAAVTVGFDTLLAPGVAPSVEMIEVADDSEAAVRPIDVSNLSGGAPVERIIVIEQDATGGTSS